MSIIIFGGDRSTVEKQLVCDHNWIGPFSDNISRYYKCQKCFCFQRDIGTIEDYYNFLEEK